MYKLLILIILFSGLLGLQASELTQKQIEECALLFLLSDEEPITPRQLKQCAKELGWQPKRISSEQIQQCDERVALVKEFGSLVIQLKHYPSDKHNAVQRAKRADTFYHKKGFNNKIKELSQIAAQLKQNVPKTFTTCVKTTMNMIDNLEKIAKAGGRDGEFFINKLKLSDPTKFRRLFP